MKRIMLAPITSALVLFPMLFSTLAEAKEEGYYAMLSGFSVSQKAEGMELSQRPGIGDFVGGKEEHNFFNGSIGGGYQFTNNWRTEGEYVFKKQKEYTSGSSAFPTSLNHMKVKSDRLMFNVYHDFAVGEKLSVYAMAGLGVARIETSGWQGNESRQFAKNNQTNLTYSLGVGLSYPLYDDLSLVIGYRYVDMGNIESGRNTFANARGLQDENMRAHIINHEYQMGVRFHF